MQKAKFTPQTSQAAKEIFELLRGGLQVGKGVHVGTLVAAGARLAGASLLQSFNFKLAEMNPGEVVLSNEANEQLPLLMGALLGSLKSNKVDVDQLKGFVTPPPEHQPRQDFSTCMTQFGPGFKQIAEKNGLDGVQAALAAVLACSIIIVNTRQSVNPQISCSIAAYAFVEGLKTVPPS